MNIQVKSPFVFKSVGDRFYKIVTPATIIATYDNIGEYEFMFGIGTVINFRSGGPLVDLFCDQMGENEIVQAAYAIHDLMYTPIEFGKHPFARKFADECLYNTLVFAGMKKYKARLIYAAVRLFGSSAYKEDDTYTEDNSYLMSYTWRP